jgi:anti-sigma regulatory factor (Ser/Thr protein kinase)
MEVSQASVVLLPCVPSSVGAARGQLRTELRACGIFPGTIGDAVLVVSELLSNAILHARPLPGAWLRVSWALGPAWIELAVGDGGSETLPRAFHPSLSSIGGRGLAIVEHLCSSWGVRSDHLGTTVWAVLPADDATGIIRARWQLAGDDCESRLGGRC